MAAKNVCTLFLVGALIGACASEELDPVEACEMYVDAFASSAAACGFDYQANYNALEDALGGCSSVKQLRDQASFESMCLPWIDALTCEQIDNDGLVLDPSCDGQLLI